MVFLCIYEGNYLLGYFLGLAACLAVAMETQRSNPLIPLRVFGISGSMTLHAGLVFRGEKRQGRSLLVTGPTLFMPRHADVEAVFLEP